MTAANTRYSIIYTATHNQLSCRENPPEQRYRRYIHSKKGEIQFTPSPAAIDKMNLIKRKLAFPLLRLSNAQVELDTNVNIPRHLNNL